MTVFGGPFANLFIGAHAGRRPAPAPDPDPDPEPGAVANSTPPAFLQPDGSGGWEPADAITTNPAIFLDAGSWTGGTPPYSFDWEIRKTPSNTVIVPRGTTTEFDAGLLAGESVIGRVWCTDSLGADAYADSAAFGPFVAGFEPAFNGRYTFRGSLAAVTSPAEVFVVAAAGEGSVAPSGSSSALQAYALMEAVSGDGTDHPNCGGSGSFNTAGAEVMMAGRLNCTTAAAHFSVGLSNGFYQVRMGVGARTSISDLKFQLRDGAYNTGNLIYASPVGWGHASSSEVSVLGNDGAGNMQLQLSTYAAVNDWAGAEIDEGIWSATFEITNGRLTFCRRAGEGGGAAYLHFLEIRTAEDPTP